MKQVHIRIPEEVVDMIETTIEGRSMSEKVANFLCSNYIINEFLILERKKCMAKMEQIDNYLKKNPFSNLDVLSQEEKDFFTETLNLLDSDPGKRGNPEFMRGRKNLYSNRFSKQITYKEFELMLYKFKDALTTR